MADMDGRMTYLNEAGGHILGIEPEDVENHHIEEVIPEQFKNRLRDEILPALFNGGTWEGEIQYLNLKTGQVTDVYANTFTVNDPASGKPLFMANVSRDITLRKKAEAALQESEERYHALFDRSLDLVYVRDFQGNFIDANPAALNLLGYTRDDITRLNIPDLLTPDQFPKTIKTIKELKETGSQKEPVEYRLKCRTGDCVYVETKESVIFHDSQPHAVLGIGRDITERKLADERSVIRRDLAIDLNKLMPLQKALDLCLDAAIRISGMDSGAIYFVDEKTGRIKLMDYKGYSAELAQKYSHFDANSANARIIIKGKPLYLRFEDFIPLFREQLGKLDLRVFAIVPIKRGERVVACLIVSSQTIEDVPVSVRNSLETIAAEIGSAIDRIRYREALEQSERRYRFIADNTTDVIWAMDRNLRYTYMSPSVLRQRGYTVEEAIKLNITSVITPAYVDLVSTRIEEETAIAPSELGGSPRTFTQEWEMYRRDGTTFWAETSITMLRTPDGTFDGLLGVTRDISERKLLEQKLEEMATHDYLTGLPNRVLLQDRFNVASALAHRNHYRLAIMSLDLDQFKPVNDTYGHAVGDLLLKAVGNRLTGIIRASDTIARMGGDEFLLMLLETNHGGDAASIAHKIMGSFGEPFVCNEHQFQMTISAGIAIYPQDGEELETLLKKSDDAMYAAKRSGGDRFIFYKELTNG
jgi:diguanylate cyclase (GGDEF)-like protein/PAS domain S-box-containing protein